MISPETFASHFGLCFRRFFSHLAKIFIFKKFYRIFTPKKAQKIDLTNYDTYYTIHISN